jgi:hypothetical protein
MDGGMKEGKMMGNGGWAITKKPAYEGRIFHAVGFG